MNRKAAAICIIAFFAVSVALLWEVANPLASPAQQASFSGQASNAYGESVWFNASATQQWISSWGSGASASWSVGGTPYTKTHYAHTITISGQQLSANSGHWKIQFRAGKNTTYYSVRWTSEQSNKTIGTQYTDANDELIDVLASALSFSTANTSTTTATFQVYIEIWVTGAVSGTQLYAHSTDWEPFSSNQISYQKIITQSVYGTYYPTSYAMSHGTSSSAVSTLAADDGASGLYPNNIFYGTTGSTDKWFQVDMTFTGMPTPSSTLTTMKVMWKAGCNDFDSDWDGEKVYVYNWTSSSWVYSILMSQFYYAGVWHSHSYDRDYLSSFVDAGGNMKVRFYQLIYTVTEPRPFYYGVDYMWVRVMQLSASWLDDANAVSTVMTFLTVLMTFGLVVIEIWRRRAQR